MFKEITQIIIEFSEACADGIIYLYNTPKRMFEAIEIHKQNKDFDKLLDKHLIDEGFLDRITKG